MKKAYNVCKVFEKENFGFMMKTLSFTLICFFGFTTQSSAQFGFTATEGSTPVAVDPAAAKEIHNDYVFDSTLEEMQLAMRAYVAANLDMATGDPVEEVKNEVIMNFFRGIARKMEGGLTAHSAVIASYSEALASPLAQSGQTAGLDFATTLRAIMDVLD